MIKEQTAMVQQQSDMPIIMDEILDALRNLSDQYYNHSQFINEKINKLIGEEPTEVKDKEASVFTKAPTGIIGEINIQLSRLKYISSLLYDAEKRMNTII